MDYTVHSFCLKYNDYTTLKWLGIFIKCIWSIYLRQQQTNFILITVLQSYVYSEISYHNFRNKFFLLERVQCLK